MRLPTLLAIIALLCCTPSAVGDDEANLTIEGRVVDEDGTPVADYTVWAIPPLGAPREFRRRTHGDATDAQGVFRIEKLVPGRYHVVSGDSDTHAKFVPTYVPSGSTPITLKVTRYRTIQGVVRDPEGKALAGALVWARRMPLPGGRNAPTRTAADEVLWRSATTDEHGRFRITRFPSRLPLEVTAQPPEGRERELLPAVQGNVTTRAATLELVTPKALVIAGRVRDAEGGPVAGATIQSSGVLHHVRAGQRESLTRSAVSDAEGHFELRPYAPDETVSLAIEGAKGADPTWFRGSVKKVESGTLGVDILLRRGRVISGEVVGVPAKELRGVRIGASVDGRGLAGARFDGSTNRFRLQPLPDAEINLYFRQKRKDRLVLPQALKVRAPASHLTIEVARSHVLRGRVTSRLEPQRIRLHFHDAWGREHLHQAVEDDGTFAIPALPPGPGFLTVTASARGRFLVVDDADPARGPLDLTLVSARKTAGRILGLPAKLESGRVVARRGPLAYAADIAEDGWFETVPLAPGPWTLEFELKKPKGVVAPLEGVEAGTRNIVVEWGAGR